MNVLAVPWNLAVRPTRNTSTTDTRAVRPRAASSAGAALLCAPHANGRRRMLIPGGWVSTKFS